MKIKKKFLINDVTLTSNYYFFVFRFLFRSNYFFYGIIVYNFTIESIVVLAKEELVESSKTYNIAITIVRLESCGLHLTLK